MTVSETESDEKRSSLAGQVVAERYRVEELIGEGGMGAVYRATHVHMKKAVAIKVLHREMTLNEEARQRFEREAIASARVAHPHVTGATDFGKLQDGSCYLVLDYVSGDSLKAVLDREGKLGVERALKIVRQMALALAAAHGAGVVHRDLKPENVMLIEHNGEADFVKVLDFGIAKLESRNTGATVQLTQAGAVFGTPQYMSPEQAAGNPADGRADLYTIGIMLFEMLSGETPFQGESIIAILTQHLTVEPPALPSSVPGGLARIVYKLLEKDVERRFQSASDLLLALDALNAQESRPTLPAGHLLTTSGLKVTARRAVSAVQQQLLPKAKRLSRVPLRMGQRTVPAWAAAGVSFGLGLLLVLGLWVSRGDNAARSSETAAAPSGQKAPKLSAEAQRLDLKAARSGDPQALAALAALAHNQRAQEHWVAEIVGLHAAGKPLGALAAIDAAVKANVVLAEESAVLAIVYGQALTQQSSAALPLLGKLFGSRGSDVLHAIATKPPAETTVGKDFKLQLNAALAEAMKNASPALRIARELNDAKGCQGFKDLLPRAQREADERAVPALSKRVARKGCSIFGLGDCYPCLRGDQQLSDAIDAAKKRPAPQLPEPALAPTNTRTEKPPIQ